MKKRSLLFGLLLLLGCEDPIDVSLPPLDERLVIDAMLWRPVGGSTGNLDVVISRTTDFYATEVPYVAGAVVTLLDGGVVHTATENEAGHYTIEALSVVENNEYTLEVSLDGVRYTAKEHLVLSTPIDAITQGDDSLFSGDETEAIVQFTDRPEEGNYYLMDFGYNNLFVTRDKFYNGNQLSFSFFYDEFFPKNTPTTIYLMAIDKTFYTYMQVLIAHSGQDGGGPFATAKSIQRGNIQNPTAPDEFPLGYFRVVERDSFIFTATD